MKAQFKKLRSRKSKPARSVAKLVASVKKAMGKPKSKRVYKKKSTAIKRYQSLNGVVHQSMFMLKSRPTRQVSGLQMLGSPNIRVENFAPIIVGGNGLQTAYTYFHNSIYQLQRLRSNVPNVTSSAGARFVLEDYQSEITLSNTTTASVELELYDIVLKRDLLASAIYTTATSPPLVYTINGTPSDYWDQGSLLNANLPPTTAHPYPSEFLGSSPFDSQLFRDQFKVMKRTRILLTQGGSHRHFVVLKPHKLIDDSMILFSTGTARDALVGITTFTMAVVRGLPGTYLDTTLKSTSNEVQVASVQSQRWKYTYVQDTQNNLYSTNNLTPTLLPPP